MIRNRVLTMTLAASMILGMSAPLTEAGAKETTNYKSHDANKKGQWIGAWSTSQQPPYGEGISQDGFNNQTIRMIVHPHASGSEVRIRLSNTFGTQPLTFGKVNVARAKTGAKTVSGSQRGITFGGKSTITIPAGAEVLSDAIPFKVMDGESLAVTVYVPNASGPTTWHKLSRQNSYISTQGDQTEDINGSAFSNKIDSWFWLSGVDVLSKSNKKNRVIVTLGDSITDGFESEVDANRRWPDVFDDRLDKKYLGKNYSVLNSGISGNKILRDSPIYGVNALARLNRDVFMQTGVTDVILLEGINDIGHTPHTLDASQIIAGMEQIAAQTHARGLRIYAGTLTPFRGFKEGAYFTEEGEKTRKEVNNWIRTSGVFDGVIDFERAVANPSDPERLLPAYDFDHLHPNDTGYKAMADSIDLSLFK
jgi:lysophospholipase L1-like esterase